MKRLVPLLAVVVALTPLASKPSSSADGSLKRFTFEQPAGAIARVEAIYPNTPGETCPTKVVKPLRARYRGTLEIVDTGDGRLALVDAITFPEYLKGISEVPRSWPEEALRAQVIAARSYALYQINHPRPGGAKIGYDICSTDRCQVYRGVAIEQGAFGERWVAAVRDTQGMVLVGDDGPIQAFYFSTSSGRTRTNKEVFGGTQQPWFKPVPAEDGDAPLARWTTTIPYGDLTAILRAGDRWDGSAITSVRRSGDTVIVSDGATSAKIGSDTFRNVLNKQAPCVAKDRYPGPRAGGTSRLPQTIPSRWFSLATTTGGIRIDGRGWGHDVGMSQYGAKSLADRGRSASEILSHFYGGLTPKAVQEPGLIRVLVAEAAIRIRITPEGGGTLRSSDGSVFGRGEAYEVEAGAAGGARVARVGGAATEPVLRIEDLGSTRTGATLDQRISLSAPARVTVSVQRPGGAAPSKSAETSYERGEHTLQIPLGEGGRLEDGDYQVVVEAYDGIDRVNMRAVAQVRTERPSGGTEDETAPLIPIAVIAGAGLAIVAGALLVRRRRQPNVNV